MAKKTAKTAAQKVTKPPKAKKRGGKLSALDAAAQVLAEAKEPMGTKAMIEQMAAKGLWMSPGSAEWERLQRAADAKS
jgi:hypothetical protein